MNASMRPSGESAGDVAESAKLVSCVYCRSCRLGRVAGIGTRTAHPQPRGRRRMLRRPPANVVHAWNDASSRARAALPRSAAPRGGDRRPCRASTGSGLPDPSPAPSRPPCAAGAATSSGSGAGGAVDDRVQHVGIGRSGEGSLSGQHFVQHHAEGEDVAAGVERCPDACSGDMYATVPTMIPALRARLGHRVRVASSDVAPS